MVEIIVGRFDRYPDLYYEMRLERVAREVEASPDDLGLYDDAGVACDRLGRSDEAIGWMARKLTALGRLEAAGQDTAEHRYRYLANLGTFHIHRWLKTGADRSDMADVRVARDLIAEAIELNPDAHFGRERYQLLAIDWVLKPPARLNESVPTIWERSHRIDVGPEGLRPGNWTTMGSYEHDSRLEAVFPDAIDGLLGLIALGAAWESVDILSALGAALDDSGHASLALVVELRLEELRAAGARTLHPDPPLDHGMYDGYQSAFGAQADDSGEIRSWYQRARAEADTWRAARGSYMMERLRAGTHPDDDPDFWFGYSEASSMPELPNGFFGRAGHAKYELYIRIILFTLGFVVVAAVGSGVYLFVRRRRSANKAVA